MEPKIHMLHLEDDPVDAELVQARLAEGGLACRITLAQTRAEFETALGDGDLDIILADYELPSFDGISAQRLAKALRPDIPFIFVSGTMGEEAAIEALTNGATDYVLKQNLPSLAPAVQRALREVRSQHERRQAQAAIQRSNRINSARLHLMQFAATHSLDELLEETVNEAEKLTDSLIGFYHLVDDDQQTLTLQTWSTRTRARFCKAQSKGLHYAIADAGVWVDCVREGKPVRHNDYAALPHRKGLPEGHAAVVRELVVPVMRGEKIKAILGVGNKSTDYDQKDVEAISLITDLVWEITERKQAQAALAAREHEFRTLAENLPDNIIRYDREGRTVYVNPKLEKTLDADAAGMMGKRVREFHPDGSYEAYAQAVDAALTSGENGEIEFTEPVPGKKPMVHQIRFIPERDQHGQVTGVLAIARDISERKQAERERLANLRFFENMDRVNRAIQGADDIEEMMEDVLDIVLSIFDCDRAFLMFPCDPESPTWSVPVERCKPEYPGVRDMKLAQPMNPQDAEALRLMLAAEGPVAFVPGAPHSPGKYMVEEFGFKSSMAMAIYPKAGRPWGFGTHQCAHARVWTAEELRVFETIGRRLTDSLSSLLAYRDLRESEAFLENVVEHIPNMVFVKDAQTLRFVRFNRAGEQLLGYQREELLGKCDYDFFSKDEADFFTAKDRQVIESKDLLDIPEETIRNRSNEERILHTQKIPILDDGGVPQYLLGISEDITERKRAEASIRKLSQVVEQSPVSIVITDLEGRIEFVNARFTQITGYTYAEALGQNPRILKSGETPREEYIKLWQAIGSGGVWQGEFHNRKKSGELFWEQATIAPVIDADDATSHYVAFKEDITERKSLEAQFRQVQKMEAIGQLAGGIAHDFNNILSAITGFTEISKSIVEPESQVSEHLTQVLVASGRAKELINQILMFSRQTEQELRPIRVSLPVREALKLIRASVPAPIEIRSEIRSQSSALADPTQIHQIVMNLCTNAAHAMRDKGGHMDIGLTDITIGPSECRKHYPDAKPGEYLRLTVADQGPGIDALHIHRIFDPFFTTKEKGEGTGMGLSVVHGIIKSFHGSIYVHNQPGEGCIFEILLPALVKAAPEAMALQKPVATGSESILFVDDEAMIVEIVKKTLESLGYRVTVRTSAIEALEAFRNHPERFDLVITDLIMPKMSGLELAEKIQQLRPGFPVVLCTGFSTGLSEDEIVDRGLRAVIFKPILRRDMATAVRKVLDEA